VISWFQFKPLLFQIWQLVRRYAEERDAARTFADAAVAHLRNLADMVGLCTS
jgi:hypothetical protein